MTCCVMAVQSCMFFFRTVVKGPEFKYEKIFPLREAASNEQ